MDGGSESPGCLFKTVPASGFEEFCIKTRVGTKALSDCTESFDLWDAFLGRGHLLALERLFFLSVCKLSPLPSHLVDSKRLFLFYAINGLVLAEPSFHLEPSAEVD